MITKITERGWSFKGVTLYLNHDKEADTKERVGFTETFNLPTNDIDKAAKFMAYTDMNRDSIKRLAGVASTGRKQEKGSVYHYCLSWHPEQTPSDEDMRDAAYETLEKLGL